MNDEHINRKLSKIFNDILSVKEFKLSLTMDKIEEWDSLKHIQLLLAIDDAFGIEIQFEDAIEMITGKSILTIIKKYISYV